MRHSDEPIITTLLDTDSYKLSMGQLAYHHFHTATTRYAFKCRTPGVDLRPFSSQIREQVAYYQSLRFQPEEIAYLRSLPYSKETYLSYLSHYHGNWGDVEIGQANGEFTLEIHGSWVDTILYEVPILSIVNEVYTRSLGEAGSGAVGEARIQRKIEAVLNHPSKQDFRLVEFGTRRRWSAAWQERISQVLSEGLPRNIYLGTSNLALSRKHGDLPIGTMAHEYFQACQAVVPVQEFQEYALNLWLQEFRGHLSIALSDIVGMRGFLRAFDYFFAKAYDGARHDSGDPVEWCHQLMAHYEALGIDPRTKTAIFSDGLSVEKSLELFGRFTGKINTVFAIGTNLTNDLGPTPLQIVIKMVEFNGRPVAKISDSPGKGMCQDPSFEAYLRSVYPVGD